MGLCGAKTRRGGTCKKAPIDGRTRCRNHGGASLVGPAHPRFKDGKHSKWLPKGLKARYDTAAAHPDLMGLRDELALVDVRVSQLLESIGETGNSKLWKDARAKLDVFKAGGGKGNAGVEQGRIALAALDEILTRGLSAEATWDELRETIDLRRKLSETEARRLRDLHQMITIGQAMALMAQLVDEVKKHVKDPRILAAVAGQFVRITGGRGGEVIDA